MQRRPPACRGGLCSLALYKDKILIHLCAAKLNTRLCNSGDTIGCDVRQLFCSVTSSLPVFLGWGLELTQLFPLNCRVIEKLVIKLCEVNDEKLDPFYRVHRRSDGIMKPFFVLVKCQTYRQSSLLLILQYMVIVLKWQHSSFAARPAEPVLILSTVFVE